MTDLFTEPADYPESTLVSIYNAYPRRTGRPQALKRIREALNRICIGEIDGAPRTQAEAIEFLRMKTEEARVQMGAREQKFIPLMATWAHGRRYLRPELATVVELPSRMEACVEILAAYPTKPVANIIGSNPQIFMHALAAIDRALARMESIAPPANAARRLKSRTEIYAMAVREWPVEELQYVPNPKRWYEEVRYEQPESSWQRKPVNSFSQERQQLSRLLN